MPFDSIPIFDRAARLRALDPSLLTFGPSADDRHSTGFRPMPTWHSVRDPDRLAVALGILVRGRALIADERRWCKRSFARTWGGIPVPPKLAAAQRFCAIGAIMRAAHELAVPAEDACTALEWQSGSPIQDWNDHPMRRHVEVVATFDAAIAALETEAD